MSKQSLSEWDEQAEMKAEEGHSYDDESSEWHEEVGMKTEEHHKMQVKRLIG